MATSSRSTSARQLDGYYGDSAVTLPVGPVSEEAATLLRVTEESLYKAIDAVRPGGAGVGYRPRGAAARRSVRLLGGAGVRRPRHRPADARGTAECPTTASRDAGPRLAEGMVLAIEPMVNAGKPAVKVLADGWTAVTRDRSLSAHFEHTVAVTADGPWILTAPESAGRRRRASTRRRAAVRDGRGHGARGAAERAVRVAIDGGAGDGAHRRPDRTGISSGCWSAIGCGWSCRPWIRRAGGLLRRCSDRAVDRSEDRHESSSIGQADLRQVQGRPPPRRGSGDLRQPEAQAAAGISGPVEATRISIWHVLQASIFRAPSGSKSVSRTSTASDGSARTKS